MKRTEFVEKVRSYIGTPFHHQGRLPGVGLDCAGLVVAAARELGGEVKDANVYRRTPDHTIFLAHIRESCDDIGFDDLLPGDLVVFNFQGNPQHIGVITGINPLMLTHAYAQLRKVVEHGLDASWKARVSYCFRIRGIE